MFKFLEKLKIGKFKYILERQMRFLGLWNFLMIASLYIDKNGFSYWMLLIIPALLISIWLDTQFILPSEIAYAHGKSKVLQEILKTTRGR